MYKYLIESGGNVNWMGIFALLTFFIMFIIIIWTTFMKEKSYIDKMASMPLNDETPSNEKEEK